MQQKELIYTILIKSTKQGMCAYCPDLDVAIYDKQHDISMIMTKARAAINDVIREYILDTVPIPYPKLLITNIPSGTVFFHAKISIISQPNLESITKQLFKFRRKAGISPRAGIYCKGSYY